jgi:hypothetical protein
VKLYAKVTHPDNGYDSDKERIKQLDTTKLYEVADGGIHMSQSSTTIFLVGIKQGFNSVQFTFYSEDGKEINIYCMKEFNPYIYTRY